MEHTWDVCGMVIHAWDTQKVRVNQDRKREINVDVLVTALPRRSA